MENSDLKALSVSPPTSPADSFYPVRQSQGISKLIGALAKARSKMPTPQKTKTVDFNDKNGRKVYYKYADIADVLDAIVPHLSENQIVLTHLCGFSPRGAYGMTTYLIHEAGEYLSTWYPLPTPDKVDPKDFASLLTYARRYTASAITGVAAEEDEDGTHARPPVQHQKQSQPQGNAPAVTPRANPPVKPKDAPVAPNAGSEQAERPKRSPGGLTWDQIGRLFAIAEARQWTKDQIKAYMVNKWKMESTKDLDKVRYDLLVWAIENITPPHVEEPETGWLDELNPDGTMRQDSGPATAASSATDLGAP